MRRQGSTGGCLVAACFSSIHFLFAATLAYMPAFVPRIAPPVSAKVHVPRCGVLVSSQRPLLLALFPSFGFAAFRADIDGLMLEAVAAGVLFVLRVRLAATGVVGLFRFVAVDVFLLPVQGNGNFLQGNGNGNFLLRFSSHVSTSTGTASVFCLLPEKLLPFVPAP